MKEQTQALFSAVMAKGKLVHTTHFSFKFLEAPVVQGPDVRVVISKKSISSAVVRNKMKRRVRAIVRAQEKSIQGVIFVKKGAQTLTFPDVQREIVEMFKKTNL